MFSEIYLCLCSLTTESVERMQVQLLLKGRWEFSQNYKLSNRDLILRMEFKNWQHTLKKDIMHLPSGSFSSDFLHFQTRMPGSKPPRVLKYVKQMRNLVPLPDEQPGSKKHILIFRLLIWHRFLRPKTCPDWRGVFSLSIWKPRKQAYSDYWHQFFPVKTLF